MSNGFRMTKNGRRVHVQEPHNRDFRPTGVNEPIDPARVIGIDTESFKWNGVLTTTMIPAHTIDRPVMINLAPGDSPIVALFDWLLPEFGQFEDRPSRTRQRSKEVRAKREGRPDGRDGRRESVEPLILPWYNAEYDLGRLMEHEDAILRAIAVGEDSYTVEVGPYSLEVVHMNPSGSAPSFEWYVRRDHRVLRLIGRDMWGYWKQGLDRTAQALKGMGVTAKIAIGDKAGEEDIFSRDWTELTEAEKEEIRIYALQDSKTTREIYLATVELLTQIDPRVIRTDGTIPASAPGAAAKIAFQKAFDAGDLEAWYRPPAWVCQMGLDSYAGGRVFCRRPGPVEHLDVRDITSAYPDAMCWLPDPARCKYRRVKNVRFSLADYQGKFGTLTISGEGLDPDFPALRIHDETHDGRLRYVVGKFKRITATIPEVVIGVASGRLRVDRVLDGCIMEGPVETSFLRAYVHMVFHIKETAEKDSPLYLIAKLLMNSLYGKLIEVRELNRAPLGADGYYLLPRWEELLKPEFVEALRKIYIADGIPGLEELRFDTMLDMPLQAGEGLPPEILLREVLYSVEYSAGHYFLPLHASNVTGFVSAKLGLAAWATDSLQGDTDSIFHMAGASLDDYYRVMALAGYPAPMEGLGSFSLEITDVAGVLVKPKMYSLRSGAGKWKQAHHGIIRLLPPKGRDSKEFLHEVMVSLVEDGAVEYDTKPRPIRLKAFLRSSADDGVNPKRKLQIGEFYSEVRKIALTVDPNLRRDADGLLRWREL